MDFEIMLEHISDYNSYITVSQLLNHSIDFNVCSYDELIEQIREHFEEE